MERKTKNIIVITLCIIIDVIGVVLIWNADLHELFDKEQATLKEQAALPGNSNHIPIKNDMPIYKDITVYYNPKTGQICDDYVSDNSLEGSMGVCMKWYIFNDEEGKDTVDMILDHNTSYGVAWNSSGSSVNGPSELLTRLQSDTSGWSDSLIRSDSYIDPSNGYTIDYTGYKARLIEANEIAKITGADTVLQWDSGKPYGTTIGTQSSYYYLDGAYGTDSVWQTRVATSQGASHYAWLFDYTYSCTSYGCNQVDYLSEYWDSNRGGWDDRDTYGYWTSSAMATTSDCAWGVSNNGSVYCFYVGSISDVIYGYIGIRPVITIPKSILK